MYEVVVTTYRGFYRYRLGDIVRVVGFYNSSPQVEFVMRAPKSSSEIINEKHLMSAMESFQSVIRNAVAAEISEFASFLDLTLSPKQLKVYIEVREGCMFLQEEKLEESVEILKRCGSSIEDSLGGIYMVDRQRGEIGPLAVSIVKPGSFDKLSQVAIENGAPASQYKPPKIIRNRQIVDFIERCIVVTVYLDG
jgi:auxin responsive GH3 family protein